MRPGPPLADVLACAALINKYHDAPAHLSDALPKSRAAQRLGLANAPPDAMIADAAGELSKMNVALGR